MFSVVGNVADGVVIIGLVLFEVLVLHSVQSPCIVCKFGKDLLRCCCCCSVLSSSLVQ